MENNILEEECVDTDILDEDYQHIDDNLFINNLKEISIINNKGE